MIVDIRIDDRLVHGQVLHGWVPQLGVQKLLVICGTSSNCMTLQSVYSLSIPAAVEVEVVGPDEAAMAFEKAYSSDQRVMVITADPSNISWLPASRMTPRITLGNLYTQGKDCVQLSPTVQCGPLQIEELAALKARGVKMVLCAGVHDRVNEVNDIPCSS